MGRAGRVRVMLSRRAGSLCKPGCRVPRSVFPRGKRGLIRASSRGFCSEKHVLRPPPTGEQRARGLLPEEDVWFWDVRVGREEGYDGVGVGGGDGGEEGGGVEGAGVEEVRGFCGG